MEDEDCQLRENLKNEIKVPFASISSFLWFIFILIVLIAVFITYDYTKMMHRIWMQLFLTTCIIKVPTFNNRFLHWKPQLFNEQNASNDSVGDPMGLNWF